ncbi:MAG TPA: hypothetical protein VFE79_14970 [Paraburkholderia sp.]|jgi:hypothetical protein|nr:hypothetical protein [Paraburkholderia sp.]
MRPANHRPLPAAVFQRCVLGFFVCFFVLISSGRLGSSDAGGQLQAATLLATTGNLGITPSADTEGWVPAPNGRVYEAHDPGALVIMTPAAWIATKLGHVPADQAFRDPPVLAKVLTSLAYAVISAIGALYLFRFFAHYYETRSAFLLTVLFALGTYYLPYAKVTWDVAPATAMMCVFLYFLSATQRANASVRTFAAAGFALALLCSFRYSLAPFMGIALAVLAWRNRSEWRKYGVLGATLCVAMLPTFLYNFVRTGSPFRPATATAYYLNGNNSLDGHIPSGLMGLFFSGNHSLLLYAPPVLLIALLPFAWRRLPAAQRTLIVATMAGALLYTLLIAKMANWGAFGWGPRYLLPVLPIWFVAAAPGFMLLRARWPALAAAFVLACLASNVAPATVNWNLVVAEFPQADAPAGATPYALQGIWNGFSKGVQGQTLAFAKTAPQAAPDASRRFPDIWTARLIEKSKAGHVAGVAIVLVLLAGLGFALLRIVRGTPANAAVDAARDDGFVSAR